MARYVPEHVNQDDGSSCQWTNCWCAVGAWLVDAGTRGRVKPSPMQFRKRAGALKNCRTGGLGDIMRGLAAYGVRYRFLADVTRASASKRFSARSDKVYAIETDFDSWPTRAKCDVGKDFDGYHMVGVLPGLRRRRPGKKRRRPQIRTMDPNQCRGLKWTRRRGVLDAAIEYNNEHNEVPDTIDMVVVAVPDKK